MIRARDDLNGPRLEAVSPGVAQGEVSLLVDGLHRVGELARLSAAAERL